MESESNDIESFLKESESAQSDGVLQIGESAGYVVFIISDQEMNPDEITRILEIEPDRIILPDPVLKEPGQWQLNSTLEGNKPIQDHFWNIMHRLVPIHKKLWEIGESYNVEFYCSIQKTGETIVPVNFPPRLLLLVGYIGASIEFEVSDFE